MFDLRNKSFYSIVLSIHIKSVDIFYIRHGLRELVDVQNGILRSINMHIVCISVKQTRTTRIIEFTPTVIVTNIAYTKCEKQRIVDLLFRRRERTGKKYSHERFVGSRTQNWNTLYLF